jgi:hypothetical protein
VQSAEKSEPWPHKWLQTADGRNTALALPSKNFARLTGLRGPMAPPISPLNTLLWTLGSPFHFFLSPSET